MPIYCPRCWPRCRALPDVTFFAPDSVASFETKEGEVAVRLGSGATLSAKLLAAADGRKSKLAEMAGIQTTVWPSKKVGIVATVGIEHPHNGTAWQHFLPAGPFAILPMTGDRVSVVWTEHADAARARSSRRIAKPSWPSCRAASAMSWAC